MGYGTPPVQALSRALALLHTVLLDNGDHNTLQLAEAIGLPAATAHRFIKTLREAGFITEVGRGRHAAGPALRNSAELLVSPRSISAVARPILRKLSRTTGLIAHLGIFDSGMVTYTVKEGHPGDRLFTREGTQLEAYCSAIGKVLLAHLPEEEKEAYLATGPFVALTPETITGAPELRTHLAEVRAHGCAVDNREIAPDLVCVAVPVVWPDASVRAAISLARMTTPKARTRFSREELVALLNTASAQISLGAFGEISPGM